MAAEWDAIVVGAGPNGLAAACTLVAAGRSVLVLEGEPVIGGGTRTEELTEPGFLHDVCSAIHPMATVSPFFREVDLTAHGLSWAHPEIALAHPLEGGDAGIVHRDLEATIAALAPEDRPGYRRMLGDLVPVAEALMEETLGPLRIPRRLLLMARFGLRALRSAEGLAHAFLRTERARALFGGIAAHSTRPLDAIATASFGLMLLVAGHRGGWPAARGGSRAITDAMAAYVRSRGGEIRVDHPVRALRELPASRAVLLDVVPRNAVKIAGEAWPARFRAALERFRHGPGSFKVDWSLDGPIPWASDACRRAGTVHVAGTLSEIRASEGEVALGRAPERPFVLVTQQRLFDTRAPAGKHTGWGYCHVPNGCREDMTQRIEAQIERFAPGFRSLIRARSVLGPHAIEGHDPNMVGGDIAGGANDLWQLIARPVLRWDPYSTPDPRLFLCSSSTPPGGGVHGMCGWHAARSALRRVLR